MKQIKFYCSFFLVFLSFFLSEAQLTLGEATFSFARAKPLLRSEGISTILRSTRYLSRVGGVAFDKVAMPAEGLQVSGLELNYNSQLADGNRFSVTINGQRVETKLYDWELVPIAKYANSNFNACFTLFGELNDEAKARSIQNNGGRILNYHQELANTLLGLRLFQLDILIIQPSLSTDLPKRYNRYLLGEGEKTPNIFSNKLGFQNYQSVFDRSKEKYHSYLICDQNRTVKFGIQNNSFYITGQPFYYFFRYNTDDPSFKNRITNNINRQSELVLKQGSTRSEKNDLLERWLLQQIRNEYAVIGGDNFQSRYAELVTEANQVKVKNGMQIYLEELKYVLSELRISNSPKEVVYLNNLSTTLSNQPQLFRNINPSVWDAGVKTMRYSAFFRYCKNNFPDQWKVFIAQMKRVTISPAVETPTVMTF